MIVQQTEVFAKWLKKLKDRAAQGVITRRIERMKLGNYGDQKSVGGGVSELRVDIGPGYRVYFTRRGEEIVILLCGGDKKSQQKDIEMAKEMVKQLREQE